MTCIGTTVLGIALAAAVALLLVPLVPLALLFFLPVLLSMPEEDI